MADDAGITAQQREFLDWLLTPEAERVGDDACSQNAWATQRGMAASTLHRWKNDPRFIREWEQAYVEVQTKPDRIAKVLDTLYVQATGGGKDAVAAASKWLDWMQKLAPPKPIDRGAATEASKMSTEALVDELRDLIESLDPDDEEGDD